MEVIILPSADAACFLAARIVSDTVRRTPNSVLGFATGKTQERVYDYLVEIQKKESIDYHEVTSFNLDEYIGLAVSDANSYRFYMQKHLFERINIREENTFLPDGNAVDIDSECQDYETRIASFGGIDLQLLGIGENGHLAFNEPFSSLLSRTRAKALTQQTLAQNRKNFPDPEKMPTRAITVGVGTILDTKRCILIATGESKARILAEAIEGPLCAKVTASALQLHPKCTVITDEAAASKLAQHEYHRWTFTHEPEWKKYHLMLRKEFVDIA